MSWVTYQGHTWSHLDRSSTKMNKVIFWPKKISTKKVASFLLTSVLRFRTCSIAMSCVVYSNTTRPTKPRKPPSRLAPDLMKPLPPKPLSVNEVATHKMTETRTIQMPPRSSERDSEMSVSPVHLVMLTKADGKIEEMFLFQPDARINDPPMTASAFRIEFCSAMSEGENFFWEMWFRYRSCFSVLRTRCLCWKIPAFFILCTLTHSWYSSYYGYIIMSSLAIRRDGAHDLSPLLGA